ncbi:MAG: maleylpyruvate isomerase family mycothiol-dependent enzyme [Myxococcales bacterium]
MNAIDYLQAIRNESAALADAAAGASLETKVPTCLDWDLRKLVTHLAQVQRWIAFVVRTRAQERPDRSTFDALAPTEPDLIAGFRKATAELVELLSATDPTTEIWTWTPNRKARYWQRRQAHEAAIHRWDGQNAVGRPKPIETALAVDGIDELLEMLPFVPGDRTGAGESIHLHCTDAPGEWLVRLGAKGLEVEKTHAKGDAAIRGTASDLDLFLWGRLPPTALEVFGDAALVARFQGMTAL